MRFTKQNARTWMIRAIQTEPEIYVDRHGVARLTLLAEDCADAFDVKDAGGPLDDEVHWIWDAPCEAADFTNTSE